MSPRNKSIIVIRNDKLGDFMLAYPGFCLLKQALPDYKIYALVPEYTRDMAEACPGIDETIIDPGEASGMSGLYSLTSNLRQYRFEASITLHSTPRIGIALLLAGIPYRLAPASKIAQVFYNHKLVQRRSRSAKPEYVYNLDLVQHYLQTQHHKTVTAPEPPFLRFAPDLINKLKTGFCDTYQLDPSKPIVFMHCGSGGSANNLSLTQYQQLASELYRQNDINLILTAGPGETGKVNELSSMLTAIPHIVFYSTEGLVRFAQTIACADLFISGSTGPLHIAGALDVPTVAFYPRRRSATALRWQTLNSEANRLAFSPAEDTDDMGSIDVMAVAGEITDTFLR